MKNFRTIFLFALVVLGTGCFKKVAYDTTFVIKPVQTAQSGAVTETLSGVKAYAFAADTAQWKVASYDDALNGVLTPRTDRTPIVPTASSVAEPYEKEGLENAVQLHLDQPSQLVLVVDTEHKIYAYTQQAISENMPLLYATLVFKPWRETTAYTEGNWLFFNDFYVEAPTLECVVEPKLQIAQDGEPTAISSARVYAFAADTTLWHIASYSDAYNRVITQKNGTQILENPVIASEERGTGVYRMTVSATPLMLVAVYETAQMYSYTKAEVNLEGESPTFSTVFRTWQQPTVTVDDGWVTVRNTAAQTTQENSRR